MDFSDLLKHPFYRVLQSTRNLWPRHENLLPDNSISSSLIIYVHQGAREHRVCAFPSGTAVPKELNSAQPTYECHSDSHQNHVLPLFLQYQDSLGYMQDIIEGSEESDCVGSAYL